MEENVVLEDVSLEELEQQQPVARNAALRFTKEDLDRLARSKGFTGDEALIEGATDALGTDSSDLAMTLIGQMIDLHGGVSRTHLPTLNANFALLSGFKCKDPQEFMLAVQGIALHKRAISLAIEDATRSCYNPGVDRLEETLKVMRVFQGVMDAFNRHRRNQAALMKDAMPDAHQTGPAAANADQGPDKERNK